MASMQHESLVDLFKNRPSLGAELLHEALGVPVPAFREVHVESIDLGNARPPEYRADLVVTLVGDDERPVLVIVIEVQLGRDEDKRFSWPEYLTGARARFRCPASLLVVAPDPSVAAWCATLIDIGPPGWVLRPPVLTRTGIPVVTDPNEATRRPELAVLSAMAHGQTDAGAEIAAAAAPAFAGLDEERARFYWDLVYSSLHEAARRALEAKMKGYEYQSDFAKKYVAKGVLEGEARSLIKVLRARGIEVPDAARERILACTDPSQLDRWLDKALVATSLDEVLGDPS